MRQFSRGLFNGVVFFTITSILLPMTAGASFVEECLNGTEVLRKELVCEGNGMKILLKKGEWINISKTNEPGSINLAVKKIQHLPARIETFGMVDESVKFIASDYNSIVTVNIPCGQSGMAFIGFSAGNKIMPYETLVECH